MHSPCALGTLMYRALLHVLGVAAQPGVSSNLARAGDAHHQTIRGNDHKVFVARSEFSG